MPEVDPVETPSDPATETETEPTVDPDPSPDYTTDEKTVPLSRFQELGQDRNDEREQRQSLQAKNDELTASIANLLERIGGEKTPATSAAEAPLTPAPESMSSLEAADFLVQQGMNRHLPAMLKKLGIDPEQLKGVNLQAMQANTVEQEWSALCESEGLDSGNRLNRLAYIQLIQKGVKPDQAMTEIKEAGAVSAPKRSATPITSGGASNRSVEKVVVRDAAHAAALALAGKRAPDIGIKEVFALRKS